MDYKKLLGVVAVALPLIVLSSMLPAAKNNKDKCCAPTPPANCYQDECKTCYCLGPENYGVNAPVCPKTCNDDIIVQLSVFYWNARQDGMEYAINNQVLNPFAQQAVPTITEVELLNNLIEAKYKTPDFKWNVGIKVGLGYCSSCDGWDFGVYWTWFHGKARTHIEAEASDNSTLLPLWSAFSPLIGGPLFATDIETNWKLRLNLIDLELGRNFWTSKYVALRPHIGIRIAYVKQDWELEHKGGSWQAFTTPLQHAMNNQVSIDNNFSGVGLRAGLNSEWNLGCGWAIYGNWAASVPYGRFSIDHEEDNYSAISPFDKTHILETEYSFKASRTILDLALGIQYATMLCDCCYAFTGMLGWEQHVFFDQNQMWRVTRIGDTTATAPPNNFGENVFNQRRGNLDTQGWTLTLKVDF